MRYLVIREDGVIIGEISPDTQLGRAIDLTINAAGNLPPVSEPDGMIVLAMSRPGGRVRMYEVGSKPHA